MDKSLLYRVIVILLFYVTVNAQNGHDVEKKIKKKTHLKFGDDYPVKCEQFHVFEEENHLKIARTFRTSVFGLTRLNPDLDIFSVDAGTPLCVVGYIIKKKNQRSKGKTQKIGKRPKNLIRYTTTPGIDSCERLIKNSDPSLSIMKIVELNPRVSCEKIRTSKQTIFLPKGTSVKKSKNRRKKPAYDRDCLVGRWSEWTVCHDGVKRRQRNVYREVEGNGKACPETEQTVSCDEDNSSNVSYGKNNVHSSLTSFATAMSSSTKECIKGTDGCSSPVGQYNIFTTACNFHDACWGCIKDWGYSEQTCNYIWHILMDNTCTAYWRNPFDKEYCYAVSDVFYTAVSTAASPSYTNDKCPQSVWSGLNAVLNGYYIGYAVPDGCPCEGYSCLYRGEPFPCWSDGTICGAGTTCENCCNGYSWWIGKAFTACGHEPCWGGGTVCGTGTTCNSCCKGAHCPWYQFGVCTCHY